MAETADLVKTIWVHVRSQGFLRALGVGHGLLGDFCFVGARELNDVGAGKRDVDCNVAAKTGNNFINRLSAAKIN
jgi:hypothetical protein